VRHPSPTVVLILSTGEIRRITPGGYASRFACGEAISLNQRGREPDAEVYCEDCAIQGSFDVPSRYNDETTSSPKYLGQSDISVTPALAVVLSKASERNLKTEVCDQRTAYIDGRPCQAIKSKWFENYPGCRAMTMYMPRNNFADFLIYVPDGHDVVYIVPRGKITHDTGWSESALEPYKDTWHLLKETAPALFERRAEALSRQLRRVIEEAEKRSLPYELIPTKRGLSRSSYRTYMQRRILIKARRCAIYTASLLTDRNQAWDGAVFQAPTDDWPEILLYILDDDNGGDIYVVPREHFTSETSLSLDSSRIYDFKNAWCVLDGVDPTSWKQMAEYRRRMPSEG